MLCLFVTQTHTISNKASTGFCWLIINNAFLKPTELSQLLTEGGSIPSLTADVVGGQLVRLCHPHFLLLLSAFAFCMLCSVATLDVAAPCLRLERELRVMLCEKHIVKKVSSYVTLHTCHKLATLLAFLP